MPIRRLATPEAVAATLIRIMPSRGGTLSYAEAVAALAEAALNFDDEEGTIEDALDDAIDYGISTQELLDLDERIVHPATLLEPTVFTHRISAEEASGDAIALFPDCAAWLHTLEPDTDATVVVAGGDPVLAEVTGLGTLDDSGAMLILPEGSLAAADLAPDTLVALRLTGAVVHIDALAHGPGPADRVVARLRALKAESQMLDSLAGFLLRCIVADPDLFGSPVAPLGELLTAADIEPDGDLIGEIPDEAMAKMREYSIKQMAEGCEIGIHEAELLLDLLDAFDEAEAEGTNLGRDLAARAYAACADPWFAFLLAEEVLKARKSDMALGALAATPPVGAPRTVRAGLLYLHGRVREAAGDPVGAMAAYRKSDELHASSYARQRLATIEFFRGNYDTARTWLEQSGIGPHDPLYEQIDRASSHSVAAEPTRKPARNEPCWCGSGRKFKVCHGRAGAAAPLGHRAPGLYDRARGFVLDTASSGVVALLGAARVAAGGPVPEEELLPFIIDLKLIEDRLLTTFADQYAAILPDDEVMLLEQWQLAANRSVFDVEATTPGESMTLRDLRTGDRYEVTERRGSQGVRPGWYIFTRVADVAGRHHLFGGIEPVPLNEREDLMELLDASPTAREVLTRIAAHFAPPEVRSPEGDPLVICEAVYDVPDPAALRRILDDLFGLDDGGGGDADGAGADAPDDDRGRDADGAGADAPDDHGDADNGETADNWAWTEEVGPDEVRPLASLQLADDELLITTTTEPRLDRVLEMLDAAGADLIETELDRTDAGEMMRQRRAADPYGDGDEDEWLDDDDGYGEEDDGDPASAAGFGMAEALASPELADVIASMIAAHEQRWLDESIPALSGFTPRQAAADPTRREDLVRLLDSLPSAGTPHQMDGGRLRAALGL